MNIENYDLTIIFNKKRYIIPTYNILFIKIIKKVSNEEADKIVDVRKPLGWFYTIEGKKYIGLFNEDGNCWVEEFDTLEQCIQWISCENDE